MPEGGSEQLAVIRRLAGIRDKEVVVSDAKGLVVEARRVTTGSGRL